MADRRLRILHVGNIANNGYLNAKLLNAAGFDCDVLAYAHYHTMGCPEWEDSDFTGVVNESRPDWRSVALRGFVRPRWFAQGPIADAVAYLQARRDTPGSAGGRWRWLEFRRELITGGRWSWLRSLRQSMRPAASGGAAKHASIADGPLPALFRKHFPQRPDVLTAEEVEGYSRLREWPVVELARLFSRYDVVHAYGAEPIAPLICGFRPYVAYEHGTLRALPFGDSAESRLAALAYREADAVLITNADNNRAADRLGISRYRFVPHPINEITPEGDAVGRLRRELRERLDADFVVFHPSRHHWGAERNPHLEKGNDRLIDGLQRLFRERPRAAAVFVRWGQRQAETESRLAALGIASRVAWIDPVPGPALGRYMSACDVVADQFYLGAFGAITPRALFLGTPALLHLDVDAHRWCFPEPPPVLNAAHGPQIAELLLRGYDDREWLAGLGQRGREWYLRFHSNTVVREALTETYLAVLAARPSDTLTN